MKAPESPPRKRKNVRGKSAEIIEKKRPRDQDDKKSVLSSSLLSGVQTQSGMLTSSLLGNTGSSLTARSSPATGSYGTGSSLLRNTGSPSSFGSTLQSKFGGGTSSSLHAGVQKTTLTSSLFSSSATTKKSGLMTGSNLTGLSSGKDKSSESKTGLSGSLLQPSFGLSSLSSSAKLLGTGLSSSLSTGTPQSHVAMGTGLSGGLQLTSNLMGSRQQSVESKKGRKVKKENVPKSRKRTRIGEMAAPVYNLATEVKDEAEIEIQKFVPPEKDPSLVLTGERLHDVNGMKVCE